MTNCKENCTLKFYDENAGSFVQNTINADMSETRNKFTSYLPRKAVILDWGCGSGRDSIAFKDAGFIVDATDGSENLVKIASEKLGQKVKCEGFSELSAIDKYDGIWACASLLHAKKCELSNLFTIASRALKPNGIMYASFKYGNFEGERNGRYFTDMTEDSFMEIISDIKQFVIVTMWLTEDVRPGRNEKWLNVILRKA